MSHHILFKSACLCAGQHTRLHSAAPCTHHFNHFTGRTASTAATDASVYSRSLHLHYWFISFMLLVRSKTDAFLTTVRSAVLSAMTASPMPTTLVAHAVHCKVPFRPVLAAACACKPQSLGVAVRGARPPAALRQDHRIHRSKARPWRSRKEAHRFFLRLFLAARRPHRSSP